MYRDAKGVSFVNGNPSAIEADGHIYTFCDPVCGHDSNGNRLPHSKFEASDVSDLACPGDHDHLACGVCGEFAHGGGSDPSFQLADIPSA